MWKQALILCGGKKVHDLQVAPQPIGTHQIVAYTGSTKKKLTSTQFCNQPHLSDMARRHEVLPSHLPGVSKLKSWNSGF